MDDVPGGVAAAVGAENRPEQEGTDPLMDEAKALLAEAETQRAESLTGGDTRGTSADIKEFSRLAEAGDAASQYRLGLLYGEGSQVARDNLKAAYWLDKAAVQGHDRAQVLLALLYLNAPQMERNPVLAYKWAYLAAKQDSTQKEFRDSVGRLLNKNEMAEAMKLIEAGLKAKK